MSSTSSPPFSAVTTPHKHQLHALKAHIIIHMLVLSTVVFLVMQLISHTTAMGDIGSYVMPWAWEEAFLGQLFDNTDMFRWIAVYLFVSLDGLHALLCIGWYADQLHPVRRRRDVGRRRRATKTWLKSTQQNIEAWRQRHLGSFGTRSGKEDPRKPTHDTERRSATPQHVPKNRTSVNWIESLDNTPSPPCPLDPHTYHPLLRPTYTSLTRHILLAVWDVIVLLTVTFHVYTYAANIRPSFAFCDEHDYPLWHFYDQPATLQQRCTRINWRIHSAGGCSATGAVILALWHFCALMSRIWAVLDERLLRRLEEKTLKDFKSKLRAKREGDNDVDFGMAGWQCPPRDVDVRSRSARRSVESETLTGTEVTSRHLPTVSQEELGIGLGRRRKWGRERNNDTSSNSGRDKDMGSSKWSWRSEGFLECLV